MTETIIKKKFSCDQAEECPVRKTGMCLEGLDPAACTHATEIASENQYEDLEETNSTLLVQDSVSFYVAEELQERNLLSITARFNTKMVLLIGEAGCGKTTILASLFDQFQRAKFVKYLFAGSKTQIGFERSCHLARLVCNGQFADTERNKSLTFSYLHLAVRERSLSTPIKHLLFTDVSGEQFRLIRDSDEEVQKETIFNKADVIFFIVDGEKLSSLDDRQVIKQNANKLIDRISSANKISSNKEIILVVNKWDKVVSAGAEESLNTFFIRPFMTKFPKLIKTVLHVASRSEIESISEGHGLEDFLTYCFAEEKEEDRTEVLNVKMPREFQKFKYRN